ncbi:hypothetical protein [Streptomyces zagrosensis]|uniref:Uncharacterized protein n=1 Tax=Streptomyces zagrosensis TaxID=1042984 RepID=A0A7W9Q7C7_9ACTN|nr:hypothetical protein [Streptomyces zagrosensis]MBB5934866.1 hypothetical protein [Streptomyces zagrosensis]
MATALAQLKDNETNSGIYDNWVAQFALGPVTYRCAYVSDPPAMTVEGTLFGMPVLHCILSPSQPHCEGDASVMGYKTHSVVDVDFTSHDMKVKLDLATPDGEVHSYAYTCHWETESGAV